MFPQSRGASALPRGFPRIRGDVPLLRRCSRHWYGFSPHTRGCSYLMSMLDDLLNVFPAYAGMFPDEGTAYVQRHGFPRIRGDVPGGLSM